jgi:Spy/CpxP family protein refolding chaperone
MKLRSVIIIIATLLLGFVMGMLTSAQIRYHKLKPVRLFFSEERFREGIYSTINPDDDQKEKLEVVIRKYSRLSRDIQMNYRKTLEDFTSDLWNEMQPLLTAEQKDKLEDMERKRQELSRQWKGRPPGDSLRGDDEKRSKMRLPGDSARMRPPEDSLRIHH